MRLACARCGVHLTADLALLDDTSLLSMDDGEARLPRGTYIISDGDDYTGSDGHYIVHLDDLCNIDRHPELRRSQGCCGLDGCDGINTVCSNGHDAAVRRSDCWLPHAAAFPPNLVTVLTDGPVA